MPKDIVVVEDSGLIRKRIEDILKNSDHNIIDSFSSGEEAVKYCSKKIPDLIIMDINLASKMNGYQAAEKICEKEEIPFIFLTGDDRIDPFKIDNYYSISIYLSKSFTVTELINNIDMILYKYELIKKTRKINEEQQLLLNNIQDHIWYLIDPTTYGRVNRAHAEFLGFSRKEMENNNIYDLFDNKRAEKLLEFNKKVFFQKEQFAEKIWLKDNSGEKRLFSIRATPRFDKNNNVEFVVCSGEDVTEKKEMERELLAREQRFLSIIATLPDILILFNEEGVYQNVWTGYEENLRQEKSKMIGNKFEDILPDQLAKRFRHHLNNVLRYNKLQVFEYRLKVISGDEKYFEARMTAISQKQAVVVIRDITDRKEAEEELEVQRAYFKQLFENSPDAIAILNIDSEIIDINESFYKLFGYRKKEITGRKINELIVPKKDKEKAYNLSHRINSGEIVQEEVVRINKTGKDIEVYLLAYPIKLNDEKFGMYAMYRDIGERKLLEKNLRESKNKIEKLHEIAVEMETIDNEANIYQLTVNAAENILNFDVCSLDIVEDEMFVVKARSSGVKEDGIDEKAPITTGLAGEVYKAGRSKLTRDIRKDREAEPVNSEYRSAMTVPIDEFGIFQVISNKINYFNEVDLELTELLISHTSAAIKRLRAEKRIKYLGFHDSLTDLYNRAYFEQELERLDIKRNLPFSVIIGDLNNLKKVNDKYGHDRGDKVIMKTAKILQSSCRGDDILARWGGDEFGLLLPRTDKTTADEVVARLKNKMEDFFYKDVDIGLALGSATKIDSSQKMDEVFKVADDNMYEDKAIMKGDSCELN